MLTNKKQKFAKTEKRLEVTTKLGKNTIEEEGGRERVSEEE